MLAMERGEVDGALTSWHTLNRTKHSWLQNRDINLLVQYAKARHPDLPNVPTILDLARTPEARQIFAFYIGNTLLGRSVAAPPGIPAERVAGWCGAVFAMLQDPLIPP